MTRTARVIGTGFVSVPDNGERALGVLTDHRPACEAAFYLRPDSPIPALGETIVYGDVHADYAVSGRPVRARKIGYNFDPGASLR